MNKKVLFGLILVTVVLSYSCASFQIDKNNSAVLVLVENKNSSGGMHLAEIRLDEKLVGFQIKVKRPYITFTTPGEGTFYVKQYIVYQISNTYPNIKFTTKQGMLTIFPKKLTSQGKSSEFVDMTEEDIKYLHEYLDNKKKFNDISVNWGNVETK